MNDKLKAKLTHFFATHPEDQVVFAAMGHLFTTLENAEAFCGGTKEKPETFKRAQVEAFNDGLQDPPAEDPPAQDPPAEDPPAQDPPAEDPPAEDPPAQDPPAEDPPAQDPPAEDPPAQDPPAEDPPAQDDKTETAGAGKNNGPASKRQNRK